MLSQANNSMSELLARDPPAAISDEGPTSMKKISTPAGDRLQTVGDREVEGINSRNASPTQSNVQTAATDAGSTSAGNTQEDDSESQDSEEEQQAAQRTGNLTGRINTLITADLAQISTSQDVVIVRTCCFHCHDG